MISNQAFTGTFYLNDNDLVVTTNPKAEAQAATFLSKLKPLNKNGNN